ncbi:hypothetical protein D9M71_788160 [compost metagenome]
MIVDETGQRLAGNDHDADGEDHGDHHDRQFFDHTHGGDDRVQGEHRIKHHDLRDDRPERGVTHAAGVLRNVAFQALVQCHGRLEQQEHTTEQHDQVATREALVEHLEQRLGQGYQPGNTR